MQKPGGRETAGLLHSKAVDPATSRPLGPQPHSAATVSDGAFLRLTTL